MAILEGEKLEHKKQNCAKEGCNQKAVLLSDFCWEHTPEKEDYNIRVSQAIRDKKLGIRANLSCTNLFDIDLSNVDLVGADLSRSDLTGANLSGSDLTKANLTGARLWHADLSNAKLVESNLNEADLWQANLHNVRLWRTELFKVKSLTKKNFLYKKNNIITEYRIYEDGYVAAEEAYRKLKQYFIEQGRYDDASWASFKEKTMQKIKLKRSKDWQYLPIALMELLCGYGEKPHRVILSSLFIIFFYAVLYYLLRSIYSVINMPTGLSFWDYVYYSIVTFTTLGYGDIIPKPQTLYRLLAVSEAFLGAFLMGLFIFTLARRYSAR